MKRTLLPTSILALLTCISLTHTSHAMNPNNGEEDSYNEHSHSSSNRTQTPILPPSPTWENEDDKHVQIYGPNIITQIRILPIAQEVLNNFSQPENLNYSSIFRTGLPYGGVIEFGIRGGLCTLAVENYIDPTTDMVPYANYPFLNRPLPTSPTLQAINGHHNTVFYPDPENPDAYGYIGGPLFKRHESTIFPRVPMPFQISGNTLYLRIELEPVLRKQLLLIGERSPDQPASSFSREQVFPPFSGLDYIKMREAKALGMLISRYQNKLEPWARDPNWPRIDDAPTSSANPINKPEPGSREDISASSSSASRINKHKIHRIPLLDDAAASASEK